MKNKIISLINLIIITLILFCIYGIINFKGYGFSFICANIGGIWCYWPPVKTFFALALITLMIILILIIKVKKRKNIPDSMFGHLNGKGKPFTKKEREEMWRDRV